MSIRNKKGFTLIEVLMAAGIFAFVMSGILLMFISCAFLDQANRNKSIATTHAEFAMEDMMEYMRNNELSFLQTQLDNKVYDRNSSTTPTISGYLGCAVLDSEKIEISYTDDDSVNPTNPLEITVKVSWKDRAQTKTRSLELKTLISKR